MPGNLKIGDRIQNRWEIHKILRGGMGIVYLVYDHEALDVFAAKTIADEIFQASPTAAARFSQEANAWVNLDTHENIAAARMVRAVDGKPYIFLELVTGGDLSRWIGTPRLTNDLSQVLTFALQFSDGMWHAHSKGVRVHRDIKPKNCLITEDGILKVTDFGLAKVFDGVASETIKPSKVTNAPSLDYNLELTRTGLVFGTCTHMAPEQFDDASQVEVSADVYSFGVMVYQMITGRLPFVGRTWDDFKHQHKTRQPPQIGLPNRNFETLIFTCLEKKAANRYQNFNVLRHDLGKIFEAISGKPAWEPTKATALDARSWTNKGASLSFLGRQQEALVCFDRALEMEPKQCVALYNKAQLISITTDHFDEALVLFNRAIEINPKEFRAWSNKAALLCGTMSRHQEADECCDKALAISPHDWRTLVWKGSALLALGKLDVALDCCNRALENNSDAVLALRIKGATLTALQRFSEAVALFDRVLALDPKDAKAWGLKGGALFYLQKHEVAIACCEKSLLLDEKYDAAWFFKAKLLAAMKRLSEAIVCYDRVIVLSPIHQRAWLEKGIALTELNKPESALLCLDQAVKLQPNDDEAWMFRGQCLETLARYKDAIQSYDNALVANPRNALGWVRKGVLLGVTKGFPEAMDCFQKAHALGYADALKLAAIVQEKLKSKPQA